MGILFKVAVIAGIATLAVVFGYKYYPSIKQNAIEFSNSSIKEQRLLGELNRNLSSVQAIVSQADAATELSELKKKIAVSKKLLEDSNALLSELSQSGNARSTAGTALQSLTNTITAKLGLTAPATPTHAPVPLNSCPPTKN